MELVSNLGSAGRRACVGRCLMRWFAFKRSYIFFARSVRKDEKFRTSTGCQMVVYEPNFTSN
jgi:hypothetical protein